jgi:Protein of unknown function (DUF2924)
MLGTARRTRAEARLAGELARLGTLSPAELRAEWLGLTGLAAPNLGTVLLRRLLAQRLQEKRLGALPAMVVRVLERAVMSGPMPPASRTTMTLMPGARLIREWQGRTIAVLTTESGFTWEGRDYRSLSHIAREVTGAHWSGPRFFGLAGRG